MVLLSSRSVTMLVADRPYWRESETTIYVDKSNQPAMDTSFINFTALDLVAAISMVSSFVFFHPQAILHDRAISTQRQFSIVSAKKPSDVSPPCFTIMTQISQKFFIKLQVAITCFNFDAES